MWLVLFVSRAAVAAQKRSANAKSAIRPVGLVSTPSKKERPGMVILQIHPSVIFNCTTSTCLSASCILPIHRCPTVVARCHCQSLSLNQPTARPEGAPATATRPGTRAQRFKSRVSQVPRQSLSKRSTANHSASPLTISHDLASYMSSCAFAIGRCS